MLDRWVIIIHLHNRAITKASGRPCETKEWCGLSARRCPCCFEALCIFGTRTKKVLKINNRPVFIARISNKIHHLHLSFSLSEISQLTWALSLGPDFILSETRQNDTVHRERPLCKYRWSIIDNQPEPLPFRTTSRSCNTTNRGTILCQSSCYLNSTVIRTDIG
jgi:hypothetical protein